MRTIHALLLALATIPAQQPPPAPPAPPPPVDKFARLVEINKQIAALQKEKAALTNDIAASIKDWLEWAKNNGIVIEPPAPPPPPKPVDPLASKIQAAYAADPAAPDARQKSAKDLAALYKAAASTCQDPQIATSQDLMDKITQAAATMVGNGALKGVRGVVNAELNGLLPFEGPLTDDQRKQTAALFLKVATIIEGL